jgi:hypothetical protein
MKTNEPEAKPAVPPARFGRAIRLAALVLVIGATCYLIAAQSGAGASQYPDSPADAVQYLCSKDKHQFSMTPRQLNEARERTGGGIPGLAPCPKCNQHTGQPAEQVNGAWVALRRDRAEQTNRTVPSKQ